MRRSLSFLLSGVFVAILFAAPATHSAMAIKPFQDGFYTTYLKDAEKTPETKAFVEVVMAAKCNLCHQGRSKKDRNIYGAELSKLLDKQADKEQPKKIAGCFTSVYFRNLYFFRKLLVKPFIAEDTRACSIRMSHSTH